MITAFRVRNLRAIEDSGPISLKRINILVGKNSSGKSTVLRLLPLLRQSVEQRTRGPILWYGRLVDFGSFQNAARNADIVRGVSIDFDVTLQRRSPFARSQRIKDSENFIFPTRGGMRISISLVLGRSDSDKVGYIRSLHAKIGSDEFSVQFDAKGEVKTLAVFGAPVYLSDDNSWWVGGGNLLPRIHLLAKEEISDDDGRTDWYWDPVSYPFRADIVRALGNLAHGNTSYDRLSLIAGKLAYGDASRFFAQLLENPDVPASLRARIEQLGENGKEVRELRRTVLLSKVSAILEAIDADIAQFSRGVRYLEPVRASAERYYREQNLAVDEIDSRGTNTAMFLSSLDEEEMESLQTWMSENFGFSVSVESSTGHIQINISDSVHAKRNIADLGYGYSQVLPIVLQLWRANRLDAEQVTVAMEQPELHLHPHFQAVLADAMVAAVAQRSSRPSRLFVETHSDHLINRLGSLVADQRIDPSDIQVIVICENDSGDSVGRAVSFNSDGTLDGNWPAGFFTPGFLS